MPEVIVLMGKKTPGLNARRGLLPIDLHY